MARVAGLGGVFFKSKDPKKLGAWYRKHLGVDVRDWAGAAFDWREGAKVKIDRKPMEVSASPGSTIRKAASSSCGSPRPCPGGRSSQSKGGRRPSSTTRRR